MVKGDNSPDDLAEATRLLSERVETLSRTMDVSKQQQRKTASLTRGTIILTALALALSVVVGILLFQVHDALEGVEANAVTNCENANESREAQRVLWDMILTTSAASDPSPERQAMIADYRRWIFELFGERDCSDLTKEYPLPPPPSITPPTD